MRRNLHALYSCFKHVVANEDKVVFRNSLKKNTYGIVFYGESLIKAHWDIIAVPFAVVYNRIEDPVLCTRMSTQWRWTWTLEETDSESSNIDTCGLIKSPSPANQFIVWKQNAKGEEVVRKIWDHFINNFQILCVGLVWDLWNSSPEISP